MDLNSWFWSNCLECFSFLESAIFLVEGLSPLLLVLPGHSIVVILGWAIRIDGRWKSFECAMRYSSKICLLLISDSLG